MITERIRVRMKTSVNVLTVDMADGSNGGGKCGLMVRALDL